jgi:hypothetical protein
MIQMESVRTKMLNLFLITFLITNKLIAGFKWPIEDELAKGYQLRFTEGHMFAQNHGPPLMEKGASYIDFNAVITI